MAKKVKYVVQRDAWWHRLSARDEGAFTAILGDLKGLSPRMVEARLTSAIVSSGERTRLLSILDVAAEKAGCYGEPPFVMVKVPGRDAERHNCLNLIG